MSIEASAKNMEVIVKARDHHDKNCRFGGRATQVQLSSYDIERMGWEEGDVIVGLMIVGDDERQPGTLRVTCDAEPSPDSRSRKRSRTSSTPWRRRSSSPSVLRRTDERLATVARRCFVVPWS